MDLDGKVKWPTKRKPLFNKGGCVLTDGLLFRSDGSRGLYLVEPSPAGLKPLVRAQLLETRMGWAALALPSDGSWAKAGWNGTARAFIIEVAVFRWILELAALEPVCLSRLIFRFTFHDH